IIPGFRHTLRGRATPLRGITVHLCTAVPVDDGQAGHRPYRGLSPAISIEQKSTSHNPRSTVGTITEIHDYLRLLFARVGEPFCPTHHKKLEAQTVSQMVDEVLALPEG